MFKVGITGNIGSGKTTVCKVFGILGIPVFYADEEAKNAMMADQKLVSAIKQAFGHEAYLANGILNRKYIAGIVFNDDKELERLNALVHPAVFRAFDKWLLQFDASTPYVMKEAALLFESGSYNMCDRNVIVTAPLSKRIARVVKRDEIAAAEVEKRNARQFTEEIKSEMADDLIINDDTQLVIPQVLSLHQLYLSLASGK